MMDISVLNTARTLAFLSVFLALLTTLPCASYSRTPGASPGQCIDAQVIAIQGGWIANPTRRPLSNWSCVSAGEEIAPADDSLKGQITVIYHRGAKPPHTIKCASRAQCRNAYRVEALLTTRNDSRSNVDQILDFFFSIFTENKSQPVQGILQGMLRGDVRPRPALTCSVGQRVQLEDMLKPGRYNLRVRALNEQAEDVTWQAKNAVDGQTYAGAAWASLIGSERDHTSLVMSQPLREPAFYAVDTWPVGTNEPDASVWVLIAPEALCEPLHDSFEQAVNFTKTWPKDTPSEAVMNFRLRYLQGLAAQPDKAPIGKAHR